MTMSVETLAVLGRITTTLIGHLTPQGRVAAAKELDGWAEMLHEDAYAQVAASIRQYHEEQAEAESPVYRTKTGKLLTDADIEALADEAERGYDVSHLIEKKDPE